MKPLLAIPLVALLLNGAPPLESPLAHFHWQRQVSANFAQPTVEQCVVLDADLYEHSAPGLRDVRLVQDGHEIPYAIDVSYDDRAGETSATPSDDRAQYDAVLKIPLQPQHAAGVAGNDAQGDDLLADGVYGSGKLPVRVPVERIRLDPVLQQGALSLAASPEGDPRDREELRRNISPGQAANFTIGANLQVAADVAVSVAGKLNGLRQVVLEMRRREMCFQPLSRSPLALYFGNAEADPTHYDYAAHYKPTATPVLAALHARELNPEFRPPVPKAPLFTRQQRIILEVCAAAILFTLMLGPMLRLRRR